MQSRMVAAVAAPSARRKKPRSVRTLETSASCRPPMPACGSSNSMRLAPAATAAAGMSSAGDETDDIGTPARLRSGHLSPQAGRGRKLLLEPVRHAGLLPWRGARVHPAGQELLVGRGRIRFGVLGPRPRQHLLPLDQRIVVRFLVVAPGA